MKTIIEKNTGFSGHGIRFEISDLGNSYNIAIVLNAPAEYEDLNLRIGSGHPPIKQLKKAKKSQITYLLDSETAKALSFSLGELAKSLGKRGL